LSWKDELRKRIQGLAGENEAAFAKKAGISDQAFRKYLRGSVPGGENILKIARAGNCSTDWLLTGEEKGNYIKCKLPPEAGDICDMLKEIFNSPDTQIHDALHTNLVAFKNSTQKDKKIENLEKKVDYLMEIYDRKKQSDT